MLVGMRSMRMRVYVCLFACRVANVTDGGRCLKCPYVFAVLVCMLLAALRGRTRLLEYC